jgi:polar amino acid transport system ATP-binding protein
MEIRLENVRMAYGSRTVLEIDSFQCQFAHCLALIGPSGGGKSTLLRLLGGLETPTSGRLFVDGEEIPRGGKSLLAYRRTVGTVFQAFNLFPHLDALANVLLPLIEVHRLSPAEAEKRATQMLTRFGLGEHLHHRPSELSGGQRQRVAIARAVAIQPFFLLLDEPTSALDPEMTAEVLELLDELRHAERPLILVTHEIGFARHAADTVAFLSDGTITASGPAAEFFAHPPHPAAERFLHKTLRFVGGAETSSTAT